LCGLGHTLTPAALAVVTTALLAWKEPIAGFSKALSDTELRSAIALAILAFVVYPALPVGTVEVTGFLGGIVNSTVTVTELARRDRESSGQLESTTFRAVLLATAAMILRNSVILLVLAPTAFFAGAGAFGAMAATSVGLAAWRRKTAPTSKPPTLPLESPFSVSSALRYGALFLALQVGGELAQRALGDVGFYAVSLLGGLLSSASAVASAATVAAHGQVPAHVAGTGAVLATLVSAAVNLPLAARISQDSRLGRRLILPIAAILVFGLAGVAAQRLALS
jgi:uncharacterized membrane protein (DUF4010 family)